MEDVQENNIYGVKHGGWHKSVANGTKTGKMWQVVWNFLFNQRLYTFYCIYGKKLGEWLNNVTYGIKLDVWLNNATYGIKL